jgi:hypothetical protein
MITTEIIKAHLAGTVLPQPDSRENTRGTSKVVAIEDKAPVDKQHSSGRKTGSSTLATVATSQQKGSFDRLTYLAHLEMQENTIAGFCGTNAKNASRAVEYQLEEHSQTVLLPCHQAL